MTALTIQQPVVAPLNVFTSSPVVAPGTVAGATGDYGLLNIPIANSDGNALVCFIAWNSATMAINPVANVADDGHNFWIPLVTSDSTATVRGSIWICPNARPASFVSISTTALTSGLAALIAELPALPALAQQALAPTSADSNSTTGLTLSSSATAAAWGFALAASGNTTAGISIPGSPWLPLGTVTVTDPGGAGGPADTVLTPIWGPLPSGAVSITFTASSAEPMAACLAGIRQAPTAPVGANPNWPILKVEAAFGASVGDPTQPYAWTDITARAMNYEGETLLNASRGRAYELTSPENGPSTLWLNNQDGAFTPLNNASPYYPNVIPQVPLRISATWNNRTYPLASGRVDKWPQEFPTPQWGMTPLAMSDGIGVLANLSMLSAYESEVLLDRPYGYWPLNETYNAANGLPFNNRARTSAKSVYGIDGNTPSGMVPLQCGLNLGMQGDTGSGIGVNAQVSVAPRWSAGALCLDPSLPQVNSTGITAEFWAALPSPALPNYVTPLITLAGIPSNYPQPYGQARFQVSAIQTGSGPVFDPAMQVVVSDFQGNNGTNSVGATVADGQAHHHVYLISYASSTFTISHYLDGAHDATFTIVGVNNTADVYRLIVGPAFVNTATLAAPAPFNYTVAHVAVYDHQLSAQRITAHYQAGAQGFTGDTAFQRFKRIMAWAQTGLPIAADSGSPTPFLGVADTLLGQNATSALYDITTSEGGAVYADAAGNVWYQSRVYLYGRPPKWVFGDNTANGEIPYLADASFDYDNAFLYTEVFAQRQIGLNDSIVTDPARGAFLEQFINSGAQLDIEDQAAELSYGRRNSLAQTILTDSDQDVYDRAYWSLNKYKQPAFRVPRITLDPAANPSLWPVALGVEQGDVVRIIRRPLGGASYSVLGVVQKVSQAVGISSWKAELSVTPLTIEANVLLVGTGSNNTLAEGVAW